MYDDEVQEIHRLRGEFLGVMADIEGVLNMTFVYYFRVPSPEGQGEGTAEFEALVLRWLNLSTKVDSFKRMTRANESSFLRRLVALLSSLVKYRNFIAHSSLMPDLDWDDSYEHGHSPIPVGWTAYRRTRTGLVSERVAAGDIAEQLELAVAVNKALMALSFAIAEDKGIEGFDPNQDWTTRLSEKRGGFLDTEDLDALLPDPHSE